jgi:IS605 OrfB family transposase
MSSKTKYSRSWKHLNSVKKRLYRRRNGQVKDALHVQSKKLASMNYKTIVVGDLEIKKLQSKKGVNKRKRNVRKSFSEACIARFLEYLTYKSLSCNNEVITISERWTTQTNCLTGKLFKDKVELNERIVRLDANTMIDRDLNAAINIMRRYEQNHLALMTTPLDVSDVVSKHNLDANP